eukprot:5014322-Pyramimonas_sp.AAC.1
MVLLQLRYTASNTVLLRQCGVRVPFPCLTAPVLEFHFCYCQYLSDTSTVLDYQYCSTTATMLYRKYYSAATTTPQH